MTIRQRDQRSPNGIDELNHTIDQLTHVVKNFAPVIRELKIAYDASFGEEGKKNGEGFVRDCHGHMFACHGTFMYLAR